jgi:fructose-1,6-bisphosphatase/inositol monophosphatase family enzyme
LLGNFRERNQNAFTGLDKNRRAEEAIQTLKELAIGAAREAGKLMLDWRKTFPAGPAAMDFKSAKDVVTVVDKQAEELIIGHISKAYPDHAILGEEGGLVAGTEDSPYTWIIDPLDGTANYAADLATSCVSIGVLQGKIPVLGVVYNPFRDEIYIAERGKGATLNGQPIHVGQQTELNKALVGFDLGYNEAKAVYQLKEATFWRPRVRSMRILGSAVLALCHVACGRFDLFFHRGLYPWDLAAATLIIQEAGGVITDEDGQPADIYCPSIVTGNAALHKLYFETRKEWELDQIRDY